MNIKSKKLMFALLLGASCNIFPWGDRGSFVGNLVGGATEAAVDTALLPVEGPYYNDGPDYYDYDGGYYGGRGRRGRSVGKNSSRSSSRTSSRSSSRSSRR